MNEIFDWDKVRPALLHTKGLREQALRDAYWQWVRGNSCYDELADSEHQRCFDAFRAAWIICEETI